MHFDFNSVCDCDRTATVRCVKRQLWFNINYYYLCHKSTITEYENVLIINKKTIYVPSTVHDGVSYEV
jgi:hypothetical protein